MPNHEIPKQIIKEAEELGGIDLDETEDIQERLSCDKGSHKERSIAAQPNHIKHWKKEEVTIYERPTEIN